VHLDPLITLLGILFLAELLGIAGAVVAVPAVALAQIVARELLAARRERLAAEATAAEGGAVPRETPVQPRASALGKPR
jgi:predicted PurR-regulated permease PerM